MQLHERVPDKLTAIEVDFETSHDISKSTCDTCVFLYKQGIFAERTNLRTFLIGKKASNDQLS